MHIVAVPWSDKAEKGLVVSAGEDMDIIRWEVKNKVSILWRCQSPTASAFIVTRFQPPNELVFEAGEGSGFKEFIPYFVRIAKAKNVQMRTHVKRKGMIRLWRGVGLKVDEYVLKG